MATSYSNPHSAGDRRDLITISNAGLVAGNLPEYFIDGSRTDNHSWFNGVGLSSSVWIQFDFYAAIVIDEATWYQGGATNQGDWKWQGSPDGTNWTDIGSSFTYNTATFVCSSLNGNTTAYRYYRMLGVSGSANSGPYQHEIEFQCDNPYPASGVDYTADSRCYGPRTSSITVTASIGLLNAFGGAASMLVDGEPVGAGGNPFFGGGSSVTGQALTFDFGSPIALAEARFYQSAADSHGDWKWQSSPDNATWSDIGSSFTLGGATIQIQTSLNGNGSSARYWQLLGVSGTSSASPYLLEFVFGVSAAGPQTITISDSPSSRAVYSPEIEWDQTLAIGAGPTSRVVYTPSVAGGDQTLTCPSIPQNRAVFTPSITGPITFPVGPTSRAVYAPTLQLEQVLAMDAGPTSRAVYDPDYVENVTSLLMGAGPTSRAVYAPTISGSQQYIAINQIPTSRVVYQPSIGGGVQGIFLLASGIDRTKYLSCRDNTMQVQSQTLGRWTATFDIEMVDAGWVPLLGETVIVVDFGERVFAGCMTSVATTRYLGSDQLKYTCTAGDKSGICDHRIIKGVTYKLADWPDAAQIVLNIVASWLDGEGITTQGVPASLGPLASDLVCNFGPVTDALNQIAVQTGTVWWIDAYGVLTYSTLADLPAAPFNLSETSGKYRGASGQLGIVTTRTTEQYVNELTVVSNLNILPGAGPGGTGQLGYTESFTFTAGQPGIVVQPFYGAVGILTSAAIGSIISMTVNGNAQTAYDFVNNFSGQTRANGNDYLWVFAAGNNQLSWTYQPPAGATIVVEYVPYQGTNTGIAQYGTALAPVDAQGQPLGTCGSGKFQGTVQVNDITDQAQLTAIAAAVLARRGGVPTVVQYETDFPGLRPGQKQNIDIPKAKAPNIDVLITAVSMQYQPSGDVLGFARTSCSFRTEVSCTTNLDPGNWVAYYERMYARSAHPLPVLQYEEAVFVLGPGSSLSSGVSQTNPYIQGRTGLLVEVLMAASTPPVDQALVLTITRNGSPIISGLSMPASTTPNQLITLEIPQANQIYIFKGDVLNINSSYSVTGAAPEAAADVTVKVRTAM